MTVLIVLVLDSDDQDFFTTDSQTGVLRQIRAADRETAGEFEMVLQAEEVTEKRRRTRSQIKIKVEAKDIHPPVLTVTAGQGFVDENSPVGTLVRDSNNNPITFSVSDKDLSSVIFKLQQATNFDQIFIAGTGRAATQVSVRIHFLSV